MTRHLYVMDALTRIHPQKDTTFALIAEGQERGIENFFCELAHLGTDGRNGFAHAAPVRVERPSAQSRGTIAGGTHARRSFDEFDVIWMRKDPPVDDLFLFACMLLDRHDPARTRVLNNPSSLRIAHEKLWGLFADDLGPATRISSRPADLVEFVRVRGKAVLKPLHLMGGMGVMAFAADDPNLKSAADLLTLDGTRPALAQEFLPAVRQGDKRVILVDGEPVGAVLRVPQADDVRSNLHVGGSAQRATVDEADRRIAERLAPHLKALGLFFVGIDVIGGKLTEVNVTSPTGAQEIDALDGRDARTRISAIVFDRLAAR